MDGNNKESNNTIISASDRLDNLNAYPGKSGELSPRDIEIKSERAKLDAMEIADKIQSNNKEVKKLAKNSSPSMKRRVIDKKQHEESYNRTMNRLYSELSPTNKAFSKFIHNNIIEKTSDLVGKTFFRPNAILFGSVLSFSLTLTLYITAKNTGFALSGSEAIITFVIGWVLGITFDYLKLLFTGK